MLLRNIKMPRCHQCPQTPHIRTIATLSPKYILYYTNTWAHMVSSRKERGSFHLHRALSLAPNFWCWNTPSCNSYWGSGCRCLQVKGVFRFVVRFHRSQVLGCFFRVYIPGGWVDKGWPGFNYSSSRLSFRLSGCLHMSSMSCCSYVVLYGAWAKRVAWSFECERVCRCVAWSFECEVGGSAVGILDAVGNSTLRWVVMSLPCGDR